MKRSYTNYGGDRPMYTQPPVQVVGGFTLDPAQKNLSAGSVIPFGTLAHVDEQTRLAKLIKSARVVKIASDSKIVTLESDEFSKPLFVVGDIVVKDLKSTLSAAAKITAIKNTDEGMVLTLDKAISTLAVEDGIFEVVADSSNVKLVAVPNAITIGEGSPCAEIKEELADTMVDVTRNSGAGEIYARRVPPVHASLMDGNVLKGTNVQYTNSH